jgi:hypothetical protein
MKFEEWAKYEEARRQKIGKHTWVNLEAEQDKKPVQSRSAKKEGEKNRLLSAILQVFNQRSI